MSSMVNTSDTNKLYISDDTGTNARAYWLASPSGAASHYVMFVGYNGYMGGNIYSNNKFRFRPLVCLNTNVELESKENGTYIIK